METVNVNVSLNPTGRYWLVPCGACSRPIHYPAAPDTAWADAVRRKCQACGTPNYAGPATILAGSPIVARVTRAHVAPTSTSAAPSVAAPVPSASPSASPSAPASGPAFDLTSPLAVDVLEALALTGQCLVVGPPGSGKTTLAQAIAAAVGRRFVYLACSEGLSEAHITGRMGFDGTYLPSDFVSALEGAQPSMTLADELDGMAPNTGLVWQGFLANRILAVPNRPAAPMIRIDPGHSWFFGSANSFGDGSQSRNALDPAFLDRFAGVTFYCDYDTALEYRIAAQYGAAEGVTKPRKPRAPRDTGGAPGSMLAGAFWRIRENVTRGNVDRKVSTRSLITLSKLYAARPAYYTLRRLLDRFTVGWAETERAKAFEGIDFDTAPEPARTARLCPLPDCGAPLAAETRDSIRGAYYPCSRFPDCRGFVPAEGA